jgi:peptidyl-dipeptidase Dcp
MSAFTSVSDGVSTSTNPLLQSFTKNHGIPPFADIHAYHYKEAFEAAFVEHHAELKAIAENKEDPSFENTLLAFDRSGSLLTKILKVSYNLCSSMCPPGNVDRKKDDLYSDIHSLSLFVDN